MASSLHVRSAVILLFLVFAAMIPVGTKPRNCQSNNTISAKCPTDNLFLIEAITMGILPKDWDPPFRRLWDDLPGEQILDR
jgi:hypothetical protein